MEKYGGKHTSVSCSNKLRNFIKHKSFRAIAAILTSAFLIPATFCLQVAQASTDLPGYLYKYSREISWLSDKERRFKLGPNHNDRGDGHRVYCMEAGAFTKENLYESWTEERDEDYRIAARLINLYKDDSHDLAQSAVAYAIHDHLDENRTRWNKVVSNGFEGVSTSLIQSTAAEYWEEAKNLTPAEVQVTNKYFSKNSVGVLNIKLLNKAGNPISGIKFTITSLNGKMAKIAGRFMDMDFISTAKGSDMVWVAGSTGKASFSIAYSIPKAERLYSDGQDQIRSLENTKFTEYYSVDVQKLPEENSKPAGNEGAGSEPGATSGTGAGAGTTSGAGTTPDGSGTGTTSDSGTGTTPSGTTPASGSGTGTTPSGTTPSGTTQSGTTPASGSGSGTGTTPSGTTPSGTTPSGTTPSGTTPSGTTPASGASGSGTTSNTPTKPAAKTTFNPTLSSKIEKKVLKSGEKVDVSVTSGVSEGNGWPSDVSLHAQGYYFVGSADAILRVNNRKAKESAKQYLERIRALPDLRQVAAAKADFSKAGETVVATAKRASGDISDSDLNNAEAYTVANEESGKFGTWVWIIARDAQKKECSDKLDDDVVQEFGSTNTTVAYQATINSDIVAKKSAVGLGTEIVGEITVGGLPDTYGSFKGDETYNFTGDKKAHIRLWWAGAGTEHPTKKDNAKYMPGSSGEATFEEPKEDEHHKLLKTWDVEAANGTYEIGNGSITLRPIADSGRSVASKKVLASNVHIRADKDKESGWYILVYDFPGSSRASHHKSKYDAQWSRSCVEPSAQPDPVSVTTRVSDDTVEAGEKFHDNARITGRVPKGSYVLFSAYEYGNDNAKSRHKSENSSKKDNKPEEVTPKSRVNITDMQAENSKKTAISVSSADITLDHEGTVYWKAEVYDAQNNPLATHALGVEGETVRVTDDSSDSADPDGSDGSDEDGSAGSAGSAKDNSGDNSPDNSGKRKNRNRKGGKKGSGKGYGNGYGNGSGDFTDENGESGTVDGNGTENDQQNIRYEKLGERFAEAISKMLFDAFNRGSGQNAAFNANNKNFANGKQSGKSSVTTMICNEDGECFEQRDTKAGANNGGNGRNGRNGRSAGNAGSAENDGNVGNVGNDGNVENVVNSDKSDVGNQVGTIPSNLAVTGASAAAVMILAVVALMIAGGLSVGRFAAIVPKHGCVAFSLRKQGRNTMRRRKI